MCGGRAGAGDEVAAQSRTGLLRESLVDHGEFTGNNKPSATVLAFTVIANEPGNGAEVKHAGCKTLGDRA